MINGTRDWLQLAHHRTGLLVKIGNRLLASVLLLGGLFGALCVLGLHVMQKPEQVLQMQAFMFNHAEFAQAEQGQTDLGNLKRNLALNPTDPNWDGVLAGASLGLAIGRNIPVIGLVAGPLVGATVCYQLDSRI